MSERPTRLKPLSYRPKPDNDFRYVSLKVAVLTVKVTGSDHDRLVWPMFGFSFHSVDLTSAERRYSSAIASTKSAIYLGGFGTKTGRGTINMQTVSFVIPALNEQFNIPLVMATIPYDELSRLGWNAEV